MESRNVSASGERVNWSVDTILRRLRMYPLIDNLNIKRLLTDPVRPSIFALINNNVYSSL